jgi:small conductance mechanosensitive channel
MHLMLAVDTSDLALKTIEPSQIIAAIAVLLATWVVARLTRRGLSSFLAGIDGVTEGMRSLAVRMSGYVVWFIGVGVALSFLGAQIQPLLVAAIIVAVVLGLALRGIADNFAAGIILQTRHPMNLGDEIESQGYIGTVQELNGRAVVIETFDGRVVHLPNSEVLGKPLINRSIRGMRRSEIELRTPGVADNLPIGDVLDAVTQTKGVLPDPAPDVLVTAVDPQTITMLVRFWHSPETGTEVSSSVVAGLSRKAGSSGWTATAMTPHPPEPVTPAART